ncbi:hypothetical protein KQ299_10375 [Synechococcus sp. CS-603]|nr:hypothetical protein [Synechococcus sp. CS-603]
MCRLIPLGLALVAVAAPLSAAQLPFEPNPIAFATYLGKEALVDGSRASFKNLSGCSMGSGNPKTYQCESGDAVLTSPSGSRTCKAVSREGRPGIIWTAGKTGRGSWQGNLECPAIAPAAAAPL